MARIHTTAAALVVLFGALHIALTPVFFEEFAMRVMWYVAQGLLGIVMGFLNLATARTGWSDRTSALLCHTANGLGVLFVCLYATVDPTPPSYVAILLFLALFGSALAIDRRRVDA